MLPGMQKKGENINSITRVRFLIIIRRRFYTAVMIGGDVEDL